MRRKITEGFGRLTELAPGIPEEMSSLIVDLEDPLQLVYAVANQMRTIDLVDAQRLLELDNVTEKLRALLGLLTREVEVLELGRKIQSEAQSEMEKTQREYFLREQLKAIQRELGEADEQQMERWKSSAKRSRRPGCRRKRRRRLGASWTG